MMTTYSLDKGLIVRSTVRIISVISPYFSLIVAKTTLKLLSWEETSSTLFEMMCIDPVEAISVSMKIGLISEGRVEDSLMVVTFVVLLYSRTNLCS